jgi:hypothetical protein
MSGFPSIHRDGSGIAVHAKAAAHNLQEKVLWSE